MQIDKHMQHFGEQNKKIPPLENAPFCRNGALWMAMHEFLFATFPENAKCMELGPEVFQMLHKISPDQFRLRRLTYEYGTSDSQHVQ